MQNASSHTRHLNYLINTVNSQRVLKSYKGLNEKVKKVIVLLTGSRTGSSLLKEVLAESDHIIHMSGEETPYLTLTKNDYPFVDSDEIPELKNKELLLDNFFNDFGMNNGQPDSFIDMVNKIRNRLLMQIPLTGIDLSFDNISNQLWELSSKTKNYDELVRRLIINLVGSNYLHLYDGLANGVKKAFDFEFKIEDPPFVLPKLTKTPSEENYETYPLLFKTPQDCYRPWIFKELFPNAEIKYIHLTRGFAQTVNGLIDGWLYPKGFFAKNVKAEGIELNIEGYSERCEAGKDWWCFDMPPNWREFTNSRLSEVCLNQWQSAHTYILDHEDTHEHLHIKFEDFIRDSKVQMKRITDYVGIPELSVESLPLTMVTDKPKGFRWKKREMLIKHLAQRDDVKYMMNKLGYTMEEDTWI
jgi:hypothetical protein